MLLRNSLLLDLARLITRTQCAQHIIIYRGWFQLAISNLIGTVQVANEINRLANRQDVLEMWF
jgi:hypothetical protein